VGAVHRLLVVEIVPDNIAKAARLLDRLEAVSASLEHPAQVQTNAITGCARINIESATNLVHYLALREQDLRRVQMELADLGLSSLGRSEGHVLHSVTQVRARLRDLLVAHGHAVDANGSKTGGLSPGRAEELLHRNARALFGPRPMPRHVYIMVTLPAAREVTPEWAREILSAGTSCVRVNTAHESAKEWIAAIQTIRDAAQSLGREVRVLIDLEGPKLRTLPLGPGQPVLRLRPPKDELGNVAGMLVVELGDGAGPGALPVDAEIRSDLRVGDQLRFRDARGKRRRIMITRADHHQVQGLLDATAYLTDATELKIRRHGHVVHRFRLRGLPRVETSISVAVDDQLWLVTGGSHGAQPRELVEVPISLPEVLPMLEVGHRVLIDDGKLETVVVERGSERVRVRVVRTPAGKFRIRGEMGINVPDTSTADSLPAMSTKDDQTLELALAHADMIGLSFVRTPDDVRKLREKLVAAPRALGMILKIETSPGFRNLGAILLEALHYDHVGVMIARGDLAVEVGFERLAELQEEILWLCEAAHVPVVWATQVLESLAKTGLPSRGEVTDAAMSVRAECVMLNKGSYITRAIGVLDSILLRMETHQYKKMSLYRSLHYR